jgi:PiT family inorganic phosphate transporter
MFGLDIGTTILLFSCILAAMVFEFINGFHDTANAVATVIYTRSMKPKLAVIWSGVFNFLGVYFGGIAVAIGIINLLPLEILIDQNINHNMAMISSLILTAIIWNLGTWYFGIPCSSSHTLIGSIFGVGIAYLFISDSNSIALNYNKVFDALAALLISPVIGFGLTILLMHVFKKIIHKKKFFKETNPEKKPPFWVRLMLISTCTTVSYSHGSNDGQKGVGLIMIILISLLPSYFALDTTKNPSNMIGNINHIEYYINRTDTSLIYSTDIKNYKTLISSISELKNDLLIAQNPSDAEHFDRLKARKDILTIKKTTNDFLNSSSVVQNKALALNNKDIKILRTNIKELDTYTEYAPWWVILMVSFSLGLGTMIGWKRIVTTLGEKIGKTQMSYAQGASAQIVATATIMSSSTIGLPVSTTHVLSSGVAGSMVYEGGWKNLQMKTIYNILLTWIITIPVTILMSGGLFMLIISLL